MHIKEIAKQFNIAEHHLENMMYAMYGEDIEIDEVKFEPTEINGVLHYYKYFYKPIQLKPTRITDLNKEQHDRY